MPRLWFMVRSTPPLSKKINKQKPLYGLIKTTFMHHFFRKTFMCDSRWRIRTACNLLDSVRKWCSLNHWWCLTVSFHSFVLSMKPFSVWYFKPPVIRFRSCLRACAGFRALTVSSCVHTLREDVKGWAMEGRREGGKGLRGVDFCLLTPFRPYLRCSAIAWPCRWKGWFMISLQMEKFW